MQGGAINKYIGISDKTQTALTASNAVISPCLLGKTSSNVQLKQRAQLEEILFQ
jgi:hypothetical protein